MTLLLRPYVEPPYPPPGRATLVVRLGRAIDYRGDDECWLWMGTRNGRGYGRIGIGRRQWFVHRVVFELLVGPIPEGLTLDHLCRNPPCCNPRHLEPVTMRENVLRGRGPSAANALKTHCSKGHAFDEANVYRPPSRPSWRQCRACMKARAA